MEEILKKNYRIFALALIFFAGGVFFFVRATVIPKVSNQTGGIEENSRLMLESSGNISSGGNLVVSPQNDVLEKKIENFPAPETFRRFHYSGTIKQIKVTGDCSDKNYVILIFEVGQDYRADPRMAKYNTAFTCPGTKTFSQDISLDKLGLIEGDYYIIRAQLPERGMWYDPY